MDREKRMVDNRTETNGWISRDKDKNTGTQRPTYGQIDGWIDGWIQDRLRDNNTNRRKT